MAEDDLILDTNDDDNSEVTNPELVDYLYQQKNLRLNIDSSLFAIRQLNKESKGISPNHSSRLQRTYQMALNLLCDSLTRLNNKFEPIEEPPKEV